MKHIRYSLIFIFLFAVQSAHAELIYLKTGEVIRANIVRITPIYVRTERRVEDPRREFLVEEIDRIEQDRTQEGQITELAIKNIELRKQSRINQRLRQAAMDKAAEIVAEALRDLDIQSLDEAPDEVKVTAMDMANSLIAEALKKAEYGKLNELEEKKAAEEINKETESMIRKAVRSMEPRVSVVSEKEIQALNQRRTIPVKPLEEVRKEEKAKLKKEPSPDPAARQEPEKKYIRKVIMSDDRQEIVELIPIEDIVGDKKAKASE